MQINLKQLSEQQVESTVTARKMRMNDNAQAMVFQLFTKNVYSNPIGTVVREITSNCFDSHTEAKVIAPVIIRKVVEKETNTTYISFIDFGVGMSPERVYDIYGVYFESTKRSDNTQIGGFGIGGKTPLAYKRSTGQGEGEYDNSFYIITNYNGMKYYYCIHEGADSPLISPLHEEETTDGNGTEIRIPILPKDLNSFLKEMVRQLYYFENIIFEGFEDEDDYNKNVDIITNDYQILKGKTFLFRGKEYSNNVHICLGRVAYPIDYNVLGLNDSDYSIPVAIQLNVGDINVTVSRESLDYNETTIKLLKSKLVEVKAEIIDMLTKQYDNVRTLKDYFQLKEDFGVLKLNDKAISLKHLIKERDINLVNFKFNFMKMPDSKQLFSFFFEVSSYGKQPKRNRYSSNNNEFVGEFKTVCTKKNIFYFENDFVRVNKKQSYIKSQFELYHIIGRKNLKASYMRADISALFNVHLDKLVDENSNPVPYVQSLIDIQNEYFAIIQEYVQNYDTLEVPADFMQRKSRGLVSEELRKISMSFKIVYSDYYNMSRIKLGDLFKEDIKIYYGTSDDSYTLKQAAKTYKVLFGDEHLITNHSDYSGFSYENKGSKSKQTPIVFIQLAVNNVKYMKHCKNALPIEKIKETLFYRKEDELKKYFETIPVLKLHGNISTLYLDPNFKILNEVWGERISKVKVQVSLLKQSLKFKELSNEKYILNNFFDIATYNNETLAIKRLRKAIEDVLFLQTANNDFLKFVDLPYDIKRAEKNLILLLKKVMIF